MVLQWWRCRRDHENAEREFADDARSRSAL
jgi:hypothetical protein